MEPLQRIVNNMIVERKYAKDGIENAARNNDQEMVTFFKGKIAVYDKYIRDIEIQNERSRRK